MKPVIRHITERAREPAAFTLVELLLAAAVSLVVIGGGAAVMISGLRGEPRTAERTGDIQAARTAMTAMTNEIRQGGAVTSATSTQLGVITNVDSATCGGATSQVARSCRVTYNCTGGQCTRTETNPDGTGTPSTRTVITGISNIPVFSYQPSSTAPTYVAIKLEFPSSGGDDSITLNDGVALRNAGGTP